MTRGGACQWSVRHLSPQISTCKYRARPHCMAKPSSSAVAMATALMPRSMTPQSPALYALHVHTQLHAGLRATTTSHRRCFQRACSRLVRCLRTRTRSATPHSTMLPFRIHQHGLHSITRRYLAAAPPIAHVLRSAVQHRESSCGLPPFLMVKMMVVSTQLPMAPGWSPAAAAVVWRWLGLIALRSIARANTTQVTKTWLLVGAR